MSKNLGITFIRFRDIDVKRNINDVLRALEVVILGIEKEKMMDEK